MLVMVSCVFLAVFALAAVVIVAMGTGPSEKAKQRLESIEAEFVPPLVEATTPDIRREEQLTAFVWLNQWLTKIDIAPRARLWLYQADLKASLSTLLFSSLAGWAVVGLLAYLKTQSILIGLAFLLLSVPTPALYIYRKRESRFAKFEQQFPEALDMLVSALRVGHSLITAMGALGQDSTEPISKEFRKLFEEQNYGVDLRTALLNLAVRIPLQDVRIFVAAVLIQKESGGNLSEVLEKVGQTTRERFRLKKQISVHTAQGRLTGWILSLLPVVLGFAMYLVNPDSISILWKRPVGLKLLYAAASMTTVGTLLIRKIVNIRV